MEKFSFFKKPINNKTPYRDITLVELYQVVRGDYYKGRTELLRSYPIDKYKEKKAEELDYICPGGCFSVREKEGLIEPSGLISIDIDHIDNPEVVKVRLADYPGMMVIFTSPSGKGVKCILTDPQEEDSYSLEFESIAKKIHDRYGLKPDNTKDISRACFLCHDPEVWISNEVKHQYLQKKYPIVQELTKRLDLIAI